MGLALCRIAGLLEALVWRCYRIAELQDLAASPGYCIRSSSASWQYVVHPQSALLLEKRNNLLSHDRPLLLL